MIFSNDWVSQLQKDQKLRMIGMYSHRSTLQMIILLAICKIHFLFNMILKLFCVLTPHRYKHVLWKIPNHPFVLSARGVCTETKQYPIVLTAFFIRWKHFISIK